LKVALVNPNAQAIGRVSTTNPPLGLLYLASVLRSYEFEVVFVDADIDDFQDSVKALSLNGRYPLSHLTKLGICFGLISKLLPK